VALINHHVEGKRAIHPQACPCEKREKGLGVFQEECTGNTELQAKQWQWVKRPEPLRRGRSKQGRRIKKKKKLSERGGK